MFPASSYLARRAALRGRLHDGLVLLQGNRASPMNYRDNTYPFRQDSTFTYFFGLQQPDLIGLIDVDTGQEMLFGPERSLDDVVWMGPRPALAQQGESVGVRSTGDERRLQEILAEATAHGRRVHFLPPYRADQVESLALWLQIPIGVIRASHSRPLIQAVVQLRERKEPGEVAQIEQALEITAQMHHTAMRIARPGVLEQQVVGEMEAIVARRGLSLAYPITFSKRGEVLHNHAHDLTLEKGDLVVNDSGCNSPMGYASDITRTIPVGGRFEGIQRDLYQLVLSAQRIAIGALRPRFPFDQVHKIACRVLVEGLRSLGCFRGDTDEIVESGAYAVIFQCGVGHQMGLDVHDMEALGEDDVGYSTDQRRDPRFGFKSLRLAKPLEEGFVVTVEPGIYLIPHLLERWRAERMFPEFIDYDALDRLRAVRGVRIEDDLLITATGSRVLGPPIARSVREVEEVMEDASPSCGRTT